jgi:hypothetical protein
MQNFQNFPKQTAKIKTFKVGNDLKLKQTPSAIQNFRNNLKSISNLKLMN